MYFRYRQLLCIPSKLCAVKDSGRGQKWPRLFLHGGPGVRSCNPTFYTYQLCRFFILNKTHHQTISCCLSQDFFNSPENIDFHKGFAEGGWGQVLQSYILNFIAFVAPPASPHGLLWHNECPNILQSLMRRGGPITNALNHLTCSVPLIAGRKATLKGCPTKDIMRLY